MNIQLVSHASVIISCSDVKIWTDPWLFGKAFNDSWALLPEAAFDESQYDEIDYLWISHEHPDHFHIPTLKSMPREFKQRVTVLFQKNNSDKVIEALRRFGFANFKLLPQREFVSLTDQTQVYCCQIGGMDSSLAVKNCGETILNLNDCEANTRDCRRFRKDLGPIDVVLNQFSVAGYAGYEDREKHLGGLCKQILENVSTNHRDLGAKATIPFASLIYFCTEDNAYVNEYANTPGDVAEFMDARGQCAVVLYPGDSYKVNQEYDSTPAIEKFTELYSNSANLSFDQPSTVPLAEVAAAFHARARDLQSKYPAAVLSFLRPATVRIPDLNVTVRLSLLEDSFEVTADEPDVSIYSQPLEFALKWPWGLQTLGVSARFTIKKNYNNWKRYRILFSLNNAELYLRPKRLLTTANLRWLFHRMPGGINQLRYKLERMLPAR